MATGTTEKKSQVSALTIAALLGGFGLGVGTEITIKPAAPEEPGWVCTVMANREVLCRVPDQVQLPPEDLVVHGVDQPDAGEAGGLDGGLP